MGRALRANVHIKRGRQCCGRVGELQCGDGISGFFVLPFLVLLICGTALLSGCSTIPPGSEYPRTDSWAIANPETTRLGQRFLTASREHEGKSGFQMINAGLDGFLLRVQMANAAEKTLDLQYYIFRADSAGKILAQALLRAADRGVRVRLLIDDADRSPGDEQLAALASHPGIEVRIFNPFRYRGESKLLQGIEFASNPERLDYRMHNKLMVIDNAVAIVGGRNIANEYFQVDPERQFADDEVIAAGPIAQRLSTSFDSFWNNKLSIPVRAIEGEAVTASALAKFRKSLEAEESESDPVRNVYLKRKGSGEPWASFLTGKRLLVWAKAEVIADAPDKRLVEKGSRFGSLMAPLVAQRASEVQSELLIISPFLIPGKEGMELIKNLRNRNVRVGILTNSLESTSKVVAHAGYMHYRLPLLKLGVELYELRSRPEKAAGTGESKAMLRYGNFSLHAKFFIFDRKSLFVGSMNFDQRSRNINTEVGLIIDSATLAEQAAKRFDEMTLPGNSYRLAFRPNPAGGNDQLIWLTQVGNKTVAYDIEPARSEEQRAKAMALSLLPLDGEL